MDGSHREDVVPLEVLPVRVFARVRPFLDRTEGTEEDPVVLERGRDVKRGEVLEFKNRLGERDVVEEHGPMERIFGTDVGTREVYETAVARIVAEGVAGYDGCTLLLGQSRTGKTHTLLGRKHGGHVLRSGKTAHPAPSFRGKLAYTPRTAKLERDTRWTDAAEAIRMPTEASSREDPRKSGLRDDGPGLLYLAVDDILRGRFRHGDASTVALSVVGVFDEQLFDLLTLQGLTAKADRAALTAVYGATVAKTKFPPDPLLARTTIHGALPSSQLRRVPHAEVEAAIPGAREPCSLVKVRSWYVKYLQTYNVTSLDDLEHLVRVALANAVAVRPYARPAVGSAARRRAQSHRGGAVMHMIYTLHLEGGADVVFADLHGSDSLARTDALSLGEHLVHLRIAGSSNRGLLALGKVLHALSLREPPKRTATIPHLAKTAPLPVSAPPLVGSRSRRFSPRAVWEDEKRSRKEEKEGVVTRKVDHVLVPYRESKLSCVLSGALGGDCRTVVLGHLAPTLSNQEETGNTLRLCALARRANNIARLRPSMSTLTEHVDDGLKEEGGETMELLETDMRRGGDGEGWGEE